MFTCIVCDVLLRVQGYNNSVHMCSLVLYVMCFSGYRAITTLCTCVHLYCMLCASPGTGLYQLCAHVFTYIVCYVLLRVQGYKTLEDLGRSGILTRVQEIGLRHYEDFNERIPRSEVKEIEEKVGMFCTNTQPPSKCTRTVHVQFPTLRNFHVCE